MEREDIQKKLEGFTAELAELPVRRISDEEWLELLEPAADAIKRSLAAGHSKKAIYTRLKARCPGISHRIFGHFIDRTILGRKRARRLTKAAKGAAGARKGTRAVEAPAPAEEGSNVALARAAATEATVRSGGTRTAGDAPRNEAAQLPPRPLKGSPRTKFRTAQDNL